VAPPPVQTSHQHQVDERVTDAITHLIESLAEANLIKKSTPPMSPTPQRKIKRMKPKMRTPTKQEDSKRGQPMVRQPMDILKPILRTQVPIEKKNTSPGK